MKTSIRFFEIIFALFCLARLPKAQAVVPPPDGGYPGFNTAEGQNALQNLTTDAANTAVGWFSLFSNAGGSFNTATGAGSLLFNTADDNTAFGAAALLFNTTGINNTAVGAAALLHNTIAEENTATGAFALFSNTEGDFNTANGAFALWVNTTGERNTATGDSAMFSNTAGSRNTANGNAALSNNITGSDNTAMGSGALFFNNAGGNTAVGADALAANVTGRDNIALGTTAGSNVINASNVICIGANGANVSFGCYIGQIYGNFTSGGASVFISSDGKLATSPSSRRFKEEIKPMEQASEALFALNPVTFHYKKGIDPQGIPQFGLVAEDVEKVNPDLIVRDPDGKAHMVRYEQINAMLLNEFLKEHRRVEELTSAMAQQRKDFEAAIAQQRKITEVSWRG